MNAMLSADKRRLRLIEGCCREIILQVQRNDELFDRFAENETSRRIVFEQLCSISDLSCGLSPQTLGQLEENGFRRGYLHSLRFWTTAAEAGGERFWRVAWEISVHDCTPLLLLCIRLRERSA